MNHKVYVYRASGTEKEENSLTPAGLRMRFLGLGHINLTFALDWLPRYHGFPDPQVSCFETVLL